MDLGNFSISLTVKDLKAALEFYEAFGFKTIEGNADENWLILQNGEAKIGLFHGMFEQNIITFNPPDVRSVARTLKDKGLTLIQEPEWEGNGPTHATLADLDGNPILLDQHYPTPE